MEVAVLAGVVFSARMDKSSVLLFSEFELSELLAQLAASRTVSVSRQKARKLRGDGRFTGIQLSCICNGECWGGGLFREGVSGRRISALAWTIGLRRTLQAKSQERAPQNVRIHISRTLGRISLDGITEADL